MIFCTFFPLFRLSRLSTNQFSQFIREIANRRSIHRFRMIRLLVRAVHKCIFQEAGEAARDPRWNIVGSDDRHTWNRNRTKYPSASDESHGCSFLLRECAQPFSFWGRLWHETIDRYMFSYRQSADYFRTVLRPMKRDLQRIPKMLSTRTTRYDMFWSFI